MAFRIHSDPILPSGLNLNLPSRNSEGDLQLLNLRPDSYGKLVGMRGASGRWATVTSEPVRTIGTRMNLSGSGGTRYAIVLTEIAPNLKHALRRDAVAVYDELSADSGGLGSLVNLNNYIWCSDLAQPVKDDGVACTAWTPETPPDVTLAAAAGAGNLTGTYAYYMTGVTTDELESPCSNGVEITVSAQNVTVTYGAMTAPPAGLSAQVVSRKLYRVGGTNPDDTPLWVADIAGTGGGSYTDLRTDLEVAQDGLPAGTFPYVAAPLSRYAVGRYRNRMVWFNEADHPNRVRWSPVGMDHLAEDDYLDIGANDPLVAATIHENEIWFYQRRGVTRVVGDVLSEALVEMVAEFGTWHPRGVASYGDIDYFVGPDGIYKTNGRSAVKDSPELNPLFRSEFPIVSAGVGFNPLKWGANRTPSVALGVHNSQLYFSYEDQDNAGRCTRCLVRDLASGRWSESSLPCNAYYDEGPGMDFLGTMDLEGTSVRYVQALDDSFAMPIWQGLPVYYQSGYRDGGLPARRKKYADLEFWANTRGRTGNVFVVKDHGRVDADQVVIGTFQSTLLTRFVIPVKAAGDPIRAYNLAPRIEIDTDPASALPIEIEGPIIVHYQLEPRLSRTFDTGVMNMGDYVQLVQTSFDIEVLGDARLSVYTDAPGGMGTRGGYVIPAGGQKIVSLGWGLVEGKQIRLTIESEAGFLLWGATLRVLREREYFDGSNYQSWTPAAVVL